MIEVLPILSRATDEKSPVLGVLRRHGIEGCVRLARTIDGARLRGELESLPADAWGRASRDPVVQASVVSFFAVGYPRGPRPRPPEDRPVLAALPYLREIVRDWIPATPTRVIVASLAPAGLIPIHTDTPRFFNDTIRLSIQVAADGPTKLYCGGRLYELAPGEIWAVDNLRPHAVHNPSESPRVNVLADYIPTPELLALVNAGEQGLGVRDEAASENIKSMSRARYREYRWRGIRYEIFKRIWRRHA